MKEQVQEGNRQMEFEAWLGRVDAHLSEVTGGLSHRDLADQTWRDWFEDEMDPGEAAELCLEDEGFPF